MARGQIIVETGRLDAVAAQVEGYADDYRAAYEALYVDVASLDSETLGKANETFITQINGFKDDFQRMEALMREYANYLKKSAAALRDKDAQLAAEAAKLSTGA